ncbi:hypothetical protein FRB93_008415 [Tulasnella sp. JGI-2019a]|nr:hypothetical protein FRB93_008415 [Tulasnella sp. JGI-2019a]
MPVIGTLTDLQRGTLWGGFIEAFLVGIYSCLLVVTLWTPITTRQPLTVIGWIIVAIYCLTLCRVASDACIFFRNLFVNGGELATLEAIDYVLRTIQQVFMFAAVTFADGLFCWRLYMIWPRSIRVILFPGVMLIIHTIICIAVVVVDLLLTSHPFRIPGLVFILRLNTGELATALLYTLYTTVLIAGRLWWRIDEIPPSLFSQITAISVVNQIPAIVNGISTTLLVLQLNLFQERTLKRDADGPSLATGATFQFAGLKRSLTTSGGWSPAQSPVVTRRRASMSVVEGRQSDSPNDTVHEQESIPVRVTFRQRDTDDHFVRTQPSSPAVNSNLTA